MTQKTITAEQAAELVYNLFAAQKWLHNGLPKSGQFVGIGQITNVKSIFKHIIYSVKCHLKIFRRPVIA